MPRYEVLTDINCGQYKPGDIAEFTEAEAAAMPHAVRGPVDEKSAADVPKAPKAASPEPKSKKRGKK